MQWATFSHRILIAIDCWESSMMKYIGWIRLLMFLVFHFILSTAACLHILPTISLVLHLSKKACTVWFTGPPSTPNTNFTGWYIHARSLLIDCVSAATEKRNTNPGSIQVNRAKTSPLVVSESTLWKYRISESHPWGWVFAFILKQTTQKVT